MIIPGDGIGPELINATLPVIEAAQRVAEISPLIFEFHEGGASLYQRTGQNLTPETLQSIKTATATMKGPVGLPEIRRPDGTEAGVLGGVLRIELDTFANVRPIRMLPGVNAPIKAAVNEIDYVIVRENTEGLYLSRGKGVGNDAAMTDTMMITRIGTERVVRYAFELAQLRSGAPSDGISRVTCVDKSNVLASFAFFRKIFDEVAEQYPKIQRRYLYADAAAQELVIRPQQFDVLVMENFLGDILSDLGGGTIGGVGLCPSGNIGDHHSYFEPIHGSAPDIAGMDIANPISQILTAAQMFDHIGHKECGTLIRDSVYRVLAAGDLQIAANGQPVGGTRKAGDTIAAEIEAHPFRVES